MALANAVTLSDAVGKAVQQAASEDPSSAVAALEATGQMKVRNASWARVWACRLAQLATMTVQTCERARPIPHMHALSPGSTGISASQVTAFES